MIKNLLKKLTLGAALIVTPLTFGQIGIQLTSSASEISTVDGTLDSPIVFTVSGIPETLTGDIQGANIRIYPNGDTTGGGNISSFQTNALRLTNDEGTGDVVTTVTAPSGGTFTKTYTVNKLPLGDGITAGTTYIIALRYVKAKSVNMLTSDDTAPNLTAETNGNHIIYNVSTVTGATTLSSTTSKIEGASVTSLNGVISVEGANLDAVYSITGQQVATQGLASGVYIVKISKGNKQDAVKVIL
ncbi:hypothetical protein FHR24_002801 [Wenyingzhuangia heitensis]|uniref:Por secretion system C-terminal sorting domain-containing protein n=1 Tax=Wenyingzhuangia heitensis TaxID=1487859 RepID=A0ABX0UBW1_9FLAO|nr:hypothetical protein [Wenyingzhuangia heitensis]NIJ46317.1 hypothetical protein [Wenyingzhuangia heitensis]